MKFEKVYEGKDKMPSQKEIETKKVEAERLINQSEHKGIPVDTTNQASQDPSRRAAEALGMQEMYMRNAMMQQQLFAISLANIEKIFNLRKVANEEGDQKTIDYLNMLLSRMVEMP